MLAGFSRKAINIVFPRAHVKTNSSAANVFLAGYSTVNRPAVALTNRFLAFFYERCRFSLISFLLFLLLLSGLVLASMLTWTRCVGANGFSRTFLMSLRHLMGFNADYLEDDASSKAILPLECLAVATFGDFYALLIHIALVGLCTSCFIKTQSILEVSSSLVALSRNGEKRIAVRVAHPQGHLVTHCHAQFVWVRPMQTAEGEQYRESCMLDVCDMPTTMPVPFTFSHVIDSRSPLFPYRDDLANTPGSLFLYLTGQDFAMGCTAVGYQIFDFSEIQQNRIFADIMLVHPRQALLAGTKIKVDMGPFHETREINPGQSRGLELRHVAETPTAARDRPGPLPLSRVPASATVGASLLPSVSRSNLTESGEAKVDLQHAESQALRAQDELTPQFQQRIEEARVKVLQTSFEAENFKITQEYEGKPHQLPSKLAIEVCTKCVPREALAEVLEEVKSLEKSTPNTKTKWEAVFADYDMWFGKRGSNATSAHSAQSQICDCAGTAVIREGPIKAVNTKLLDL